MPVRMTPAWLLPSQSIEHSVEERARLVGSPDVAAVVSKFLWERGLVVEKTGLYSFLVLFSMGITKGKWRC